MLHFLTMKKLCFVLLLQCLVIFSFSQANYDHRKAFDPDFYTQAPNEFRSSSTVSVNIATSDGVGSRETAYQAAMESF